MTTASSSFLFVLVFSGFLTSVNAHVGAWHKGMYCLKGNVQGVDDRQTNAAFQPMYKLTKREWWFHHINNCDQFPPAPGDFLELPANGTVTIEHAVNRVFTTVAPDPVLGTFVDGKEHPGLGFTDEGKDGGCIVEPNIHTQNETMAAGTALAISYTSDLTKVTPENLVVFSVLYNTPWRRIANFAVPDLPACPPEGCICAWGWIPNGCGEPNMYMQGFKCRVTNASPVASRMVGRAKPPVWCAGDPSKCVKGPKQMLYWNQLEGNNIEVTGYNAAGQPNFPGYNMKCGFENGAQNDIFL